VFGYHTGKPAVFLWQWIGAALLFLFPAITYTLQVCLGGWVGVGGCAQIPRMNALPPIPLSITPISNLRRWFVPSPTCPPPPPPTV
jgi:hypothetical protein